MVIVFHIVNIIIVKLYSVVTNKNSMSNRINNNKQINKYVNYDYALYI